MSRAVKFCSLNIDAVHRSLDDHVLLGVQAAADFMTLTGGNTQLLAQATHFQAVRHARRSAVIAGGRMRLSLTATAPTLRRVHGGSLAHQVGDIHEIIRPAVVAWGTFREICGSLHRGGPKAKPRSFMSPGKGVTRRMAGIAA